MKSLIFVLAMSFSAMAFAQFQPIQQVVSADVSFPCTGSQPTLTVTPVLNVYSTSGGYRVPNFGTNQVFLDGNQVIIQASSGEKSVLGTLKQEVSCQFDYDMNAYKPAWTNVVVNPALSIKVTVGTPGALQIIDASIPHTYNMNW